MTDHKNATGQVRAPQGIGAFEADISGQTNHPRALRTRIVELGIRVIWGKEAFPACMAANVPLLRAGLRMAWLRAIGAAGVKKFVTRGALGHDFVCHVGDLAEYPYYHRCAFQYELAICAAWLRSEHKPVVYDVGANVGVFATQLAQILAEQVPDIYAFEPVPPTLAKLVQSLELLGLHDRVHPIAAAVLDDARPVELSYCERNSLYARIVSRNEPRPGEALVSAPGMTLDGFHASIGARPSLLKIDVEGYETAVLRGAKQLLAGPHRPVVLFEYYPEAMRECGVSADAFDGLLAGYGLHYVDGFEGQRMAFGRRVARVDESLGACNLFAVPLTDGWSARWDSALADASWRLGGPV
jgi:FkbM family methyltransferase